MQKHRSDEEMEQLRRDVASMSRRGMRNKDIAAILSVKRSDVDRAKTWLFSKGLLAKSPPAMDVFSHALPSESGCLVWRKATTTHGYGKARVNGVLVQAHRLAWEAVNGKVPDGLFALHKCDNPPCINPDHLFLGTMSDNSKDCWDKNRSALRRWKESAKNGR